MNITQQDIQDLIARTPDTPGNQTILAALDQLSSQASVDRQLYSYSNVLAVAGAANAIASGTVSAPVNTPILADASFLWTATTYLANTANAAQTFGTFVYPNVSVLIVDTGSGRQFMDLPVPIPELAGNGQYPYMLALPRLIAPNSVIQCTYTNFDAAAGYNIYMAFHGFKIYKLS